MKTEDFGIEHIIWLRQMAWNHSIFKAQSKFILSLTDAWTAADEFDHDARNAIAGLLMPYLMNTFERCIPKKF